MGSLTRIDRDMVIQRLLIDEHVSMSSNEIAKLVTIAATETNGFMRLPDDLLLRDQRLLRILRWATHTEQRYIAKLSCMPVWKYQFYEYGVWSIDKVSSQRIVKAIRDVFEENGLYGRVNLELVTDAITTVYSRLNRGIRKFPPMKLMTDQEFLQLVKTTFDWTDCFQRYPPLLLVLWAQSLLVYRMALGMSRPLFQIALGIRHSTLEKRENGMMPIRFYATAKSYMDKLRDVHETMELQRTMDEDALLQNFRHFRKLITEETRADMRRFGQEGTKIFQWSMKSVNANEKSVIDLLQENRVKCYFPNEQEPKTRYRCVIHPCLFDGYRMRYADFCAPDNENPMMIAECRTVSLPRDEGFVREIRDVFHDMRLCNPSAKFVVILIGANNPILTPPPYLTDIDAVFIDANLRLLPVYVKSLLSNNKPQLPSFFKYESKD